MLPTCLALDLCALIAAVVVTFYTWTLPRRIWIDVRALPEQQARTKEDSGFVYLTYQSPETFTPERWNCNLADIATSGQSTYRSLCNQNVAAKALMIPLAVIAILLFVLHYTLWRKKNLQAYRNRGRNISEDHAGTAESNDERRAPPPRYSASSPRLFEMGQQESAELPYWTTTRTEMPVNGDSEDVEELDAGVAAQEMPAYAKC